MKKAIFQSLSITEHNVLSRQDLKRIVGGYMDDGDEENGNGCCAHCKDHIDADTWCCGLTKQAAKDLADSWVGIAGITESHWCCSSCTQYTSSNCE